MILTGAIFSVLLEVVQNTFLIGLLALIFSGGYFGAFYLDIIGSTMTGRDEVPDWPSFGNVFDDILSPFFRLIGLLLISFAPTIALVYLADQKQTWYVPALWGAIVLGWLYFPMAVLASLAFGGLEAALPHIVFPAVFKAMPGYLLVFGAIVAIGAVSGLTQAYLDKIPFLGWFLTAAVALYVMMFEARLIGLIYRDKRDEFAWD